MGIMTGLRERQKADRDRRILEAASRLFLERGYAKTKMETIAAQAEVSIGTVYNYYENKGDLLVAIVSMEVNEVLNAGSVLLGEPGRNVERAVNRLLSIYLDHSLVYLNKEMWRHAMAITTRQPETHYGRAYNALDTRLSAQVCALVASLKRAGRVKRDVDTRAVGELFFNNTNMMFTIFVKTESMSLDSLKAAITRQNRPLARAIAVA
jgi:AcrR family transcriptional regulator